MITTVFNLKNLGDIKQMIPTGLNIILKSSEIIWSYLWQMVFFNTIPNRYSVVHDRRFANNSPRKVEHCHQTHSSPKDSPNPDNNFLIFPGVCSILVFLLFN